MNSSHQPAPPLLSASFSPASISIPGRLIAGKKVLITGAGGSIGSAIAYALAPHNPAQILLLESSEQALYQIDRDLAAVHKPILASICDAPALDEIFAQHRPELVFHAAAYKHVPLMELHPFGAIQNNSLGTFSLTQAAVRYRAEQIILVSTDKAVEPISIMGASKRIAELTALALQSHTTGIKAVRLGNVYESQGSVVPLFRQQIAGRQSVTVTHPSATRYFLTLDQAVSLLLSALSEEFPSAILVPDLQKPVRIQDIAQSLIQQSGSTSQIAYTGLRAGEKLHEQLLSASESFLDSARAPLRAIRSPGVSAAEAVRSIAELQDATQSRDLDHLLQIVNRLVPAFIPSETLLAGQVGRVAAECRP